MPSRPLKQAVARVLGIHGMRGSHVVKAQVAKEIDRELRIEQFDAADLSRLRLMVIEEEMTSQMKKALPADVVNRLSIAGRLPQDIMTHLHSLPAWIALREGRDAPWAFTLSASPREWLMNAEMKSRKARQTGKQAKLSRTIAELLNAHGANSLEQIVGQAA